MNYSDYKQKFLDDVNRLFQKVPLELLELNLSDSVPVFFITPQNEGELSNNWENLNLYIAANYQTILESEFSSWNIYLFFLMESPIQKTLKYQIENDTFSSRKIVIEKQLSKEAIISEHILNDNLEISIDSNQKEEFNKNILISQTLDGRTIRGKKKLTAEAEQAVNEIKEALKPKNHEI